MSKNITPHVSVDVQHRMNVGYNGMHTQAQVNDTLENGASLVEDNPTTVGFEAMAFGERVTACATISKQGRHSTACQNEAELEKALISRGLPAEIEARSKQCIYYCDRILSLLEEVA